MKEKRLITGKRLRAGLVLAKHKLLTHKSAGVDQLLVKVGLCIIALLLIVVFKDQLSAFISTIFTQLTTKAQGILGT